MQPNASASPDHFASPQGRYRRLWGYFLQVSVGFGIGAVFLLVTNLLSLRIPGEIGASVQDLRDAATGTALDIGSIKSHAVTIAFLAMGAALARILSRIFVFNAARSIEYTLRNDLFVRLTTLDDPYFQRASTG